MPEGIGVTRESRVLSPRRARAHEGEGGRWPPVEHPLLLQIRLRALWRWHAVDAQSPGYHLVAEVPSVLDAHAGARGKHVPCRCRRQALALPTDTGEERLSGETGMIRARRQVVRRNDRPGLHE